MQISQKECHDSHFIRQFLIPYPDISQYFKQTIPTTEYRHLAVKLIREAIENRTSHPTPNSFKMQKEVAPKITQIKQPITNPVKIFGKPKIQQNQQLYCVIHDSNHPVISPKIASQPSTRTIETDYQKRRHASLLKRLSINRAIIQYQLVPTTKFQLGSSKNIAGSIKNINDSVKDINRNVKDSNGNVRNINGSAKNINGSFKNINTVGKIFHRDSKQNNSSAHVYESNKYYQTIHKNQREIGQINLKLTQLMDNDNLSKQLLKKSEQQKKRIEELERRQKQLEAKAKSKAIIDLKKASEKSFGRRKSKKYSIQANLPEAEKEDQQENCSCCSEEEQIFDQILKNSQIVQSFIKRNSQVSTADINKSILSMRKTESKLQQDKASKKQILHQSRPNKQGMQVPIIKLTSPRASELKTIREKMQERDSLLEKSYKITGDPIYPVSKSSSSSDKSSSSLSQSQSQS